MDVSELPGLVLDKLVPFLKVKDVLNCSMTSISWRAAFNQDRYWKHVYLREYNEALINCLQNRPCLVNPVFQVHIAEGSELEPLCEWKIHFMRTQHLKKNIHLGRYHVQELPEEMFPLVREITGSNGDMLYCRDQGELKVLNVIKTPMVQTKLSPPFPDLKISLLHFIQDTHLLVIVQRNVLQVSTMSGNDFVVKYRRLFDKPEVHSEDIPDTKCIDNWYNAKFSRGFQQEHDLKIIDQRLVAVVCDVTRLSLHVWNVNTGRKENEVMLSTAPQSIMPYHLYECGTGKLVIDVSSFDGGIHSNNIYIYDLDSRDVPQVLHLPEQEVLGCITDCDLVVIRELYKEITRPTPLLHFYDISTGKLVLRKTFPCYPDSDVYFHDTYFMYFNVSWDGYEVLNTKSMRTVNSCLFPNRPSYKPELYTEIFFDHFIFFYADFDSYCDKSFHKIDAQVWMGNTQVYSFPLPKALVYTTKKYYTKICFDIAEYGSYILNFW